MADPHAHDHTEFGWRTKFWSSGFSTEIGPVVLLAQAMVGSTAITPNISNAMRTDFWAYYVLAGIERGDWRFAVRFDHFATVETTTESGPKDDEHGIAGTAAVTWTPRKGISLMSEVMTTSYDRPQRALIGKRAHVVETQVQFALRLSF